MLTYRIAKAFFVLLFLSLPVITGASSVNVFEGSYCPNESKEFYSPESLVLDEGLGQQLLAKIKSAHPSEMRFNSAGYNFTGAVLSMNGVLAIAGIYQSVDGKQGHFIIHEAIPDPNAKDNFHLLYLNKCRTLRQYSDAYVFDERSIDEEGVNAIKSFFRKITHELNKDKNTDEQAPLSAIGVRG